MPARPPAPAAVTAAPVTLVVGEEEFLVDRAVRELIAAAAPASKATPATSTTATERRSPPASWTG